jgi:hypothetical protein
MAVDRTIFTVTIPNGGGNIGILINKHNKKFWSISQEFEEDDADSLYSASLHGDHDTPAPDWANATEPDILRITTDHKPKNPERGFVFGRNEDLYDILLDHTTTSKEQFAIRPLWAHRTILFRNHSVRFTYVEFDLLKESTRLKTQRAFVPHEIAKIRLGNGIYIHIESSDEPTGWKEYCTSFITPFPTLNNFGIEPVSETTDASKRAPVYIRGTRLGKGANAEVFAAFEKHTATRYAMKVFKEKGRWREPEILESLKHVGCESFPGEMTS